MGPTYVHEDQQGLETEFYLLHLFLHNLEVSPRVARCLQSRLPALQERPPTLCLATPALRP